MLSLLPIQKKLSVSLRSNATLDHPATPPIPIAIIGTA